MGSGGSVVVVVAPGYSGTIRLAGVAVGVPPSTGVGTGNLLRCRLRAAFQQPPRIGNHRAGRLRAWTGRTTRSTVSPPTPGSPAWSASTGTARSRWPGRTASPTAAGGVANTVDTRFAIASGTKGLTALTAVDDYVLSVPVHELATTEQYL